MGIFDKIKEPIFLKDDHEAENQLNTLIELRKTASGKAADLLDEEISKVNAGIYGEKAVNFEIANSHTPMIVLHNLYLEHNGLTAQIDYLIVTRKHIYVVECKNMYGDIEINSSGDFIRTFYNGRRTRKEGIYSPITQNIRHLELVKQVRLESKKNIITKTFFEKNFYTSYKSIVVLANPKTVLNSKYAKKEIKNQVIKVDQLISYIKKTDSVSKDEPMNKKDMEDLANFFLYAHKTQSTDYTEKFKKMINPENMPEDQKEIDSGIEIEDQSIVKCPKCGIKMIRRKATQGKNIGKEFYGCPNFPKCRSIIEFSREINTEEKFDI